MCLLYTYIRSTIIVYSRVGSKSPTGFFYFAISHLQVGIRKLAVLHVRPSDLPLISVRTYRIAISSQYESEGMTHLCLRTHLCTVIIICPAQETFFIYITLFRIVKNKTIKKVYNNTTVNINFKENFIHLFLCEYLYPASYLNSYSCSWEQ